MASVPNVCGGGWAETKAAYRLLDNARLDFREVLRAHSVPTLERIRQQSRVLCLQDTTELDYSGRPSMAGLGRLNYEQRQGLYLHPTLVISEAGVALGVTDCWHWARCYRSLRQAKPGEGGSYVEGKTSLKPSERPDRCKSCPAKAGHQPEPSVAWSRSDPDCEAYTGGL
ncbi:hypothetical protein MIT9_P2207 [Methylomarinovum caldicuralii]|uniref:Transposase Tn5-like N-terminal domain-containing protein n=2 Tax=Methylomarinovum caldicuralii TaxID=438856 RepID=A0AAU9CLQ8_9GAMM|nr:hypothetical protein MIT9_P2207 [Methylomarinovum caldicuralii]